MPNFVAPCIGDLVQLRRELKVFQYSPTSDKQRRILARAGFVKDSPSDLTLPASTILKIVCIEIRQGPRFNRKKNVVGVEIQAPSPAADAIIYGINADVLDGARLLQRGRTLYQGEVDMHVDVPDNGGLDGGDGDDDGDDDAAAAAYY